MQDWEKKTIKIAEVYIIIFGGQLLPWDYEMKEVYKEIFDPMNEHEKVVFFHINMLLRKSNANHTISYNWVDQITTFLVRREDGVPRHKILP